MIKVKFLGAAGTVTGSKYLVTTPEVKFLVDFGMFQGHRNVEQRNYDFINFNAEDIDYLLLTHAHLDHCGMIPILVKNGFRGKIIATSATYDLANVVLLDSANLQEEEAKTVSKKNERRGLPVVEPLYTVEDAIQAVRYFINPVKYGEEIRLSDNIRVVYRDAGHILGSAFLEMEVYGKKIIFSGDLGNNKKPVIRDPESPKLHDPDYVFLESTYGDRRHKSVESSKRELLEAIVETYRSGGNAVIPSFAIERAQDILYFLREFSESGELPPVRVFLDSPMAIQSNGIFRLHKECYDEQALSLFKRHEDIFRFPGLTITRSVQSSKEINNIKSGAVIIAGSGMCTGGRVKHHLKHNLWRKESSVIFIGYQAEGTLGRKIVEGENPVEIYGERINVNAKIYTIGGFSAHADREELLSWVKRAGGSGKVFNVHGEKQSLSAMKQGVESEGFTGYIPSYMEEIEI